MADRRQHSPNFAVPAFVQNDFQPAVGSRFFQESNIRSTNSAFGDVDAFFEFSQISRLGLAVDLHVILFFDTVTRMSQLVRQIAVVGHQN